MRRAKRTDTLYRQQCGLSWILKVAVHEVTTGVEMFKLPYKDYFKHICSLGSFSLDAKLFLSNQLE
jgi:hypothetical protein